MKREETFKVEETLIMETSFGPVGGPEKVNLEVTVGIKDDGDYGWFELYDIKTGGENWYAEGGLWFSGNKLVEYDGVFDLPSFITDKLEEWGYEIEL